MRLQRMEVEAFFAGRPKELFLYDELERRLHALLPDYAIKVQKSQMTFVNPRVFLCVSMKWKNSLTLTFGLPFKAESERIQAASEPYPGRWTHHVKVSDVSQIDEELLVWISASYAFAKQKK